MELSRRNLLRYGAVAGAGMMLPRHAHASGAMPPVASLVNPSALYTYDEGEDGAPVVEGYGVVAAIGSPVYSAANAAHGGMGWLSEQGVGGGRLAYANPATAGSSGSVYLVPHTLSGSTVNVVSLWSDIAATSAEAAIRLRPDGRVEVVNSTGARQALSGNIWLRGRRVRVDWLQTWDGAHIGLSVWVYVDPNVEGWRPEAILLCAFSTAEPTYVCLGQEDNRAADVGCDTYREYDVATMPTPYWPTVGGTALHTYDDGIEGHVVAAGDDMVTSTGGRPTYAAAAAKHGRLGVLLPTAGGGVVRYDNPNPLASTGSLYVRTAVRGSSESRIMALLSGSVVLGQLKLSRQGALCLADAAGREMAETTSKARIARWTRIDWQQTWDGSTMDVTARYFATDGESPDNYTEITASIPTAATPDTIAIGTSVTGWKIALDTLRTYGDVTAWPVPFQPHVIIRAPGTAVWAGDATQTTVEISGYTNDTTYVGLLVSTSIDLADAVRWPAAEPNPAGWNKWSVTGLTPGTRYYYALTDSPGGGDPTPLGIVAMFKTLQPAGVPCTIRLALGSCAQNNPTTPATFDDIAAWAPDRIVHLGDFGYPNNLTRDITTHMDNWSRNATDVGFQKIMTIACMDYVISDHDDNGTGNSNLPNYDDPVTAASICAWQHVVPARIDDPEVPPHGRWRSDVEGNVRFVKLDTRSLDKSDTSTLPTDPRSPSSTMLGATQLTWLQGQLDKAARDHQLTIIFSDCAWNGTSPGPPIPVSYCDKWPSYIYERDLISDYAAAAGVHLLIVFGDSHGLQQDDGRNEKNGFAAICCGPFDQELHMHFQDSYQWSYPAGILDEGGPYRTAQQYQRLTISQDLDSNVITVTAEARDCSPVVEGTPATVRTMTKTYRV